MKNPQSKTPARDTKIRAVVLAAGRGSRLGGAAEEIPKCLLEVGRKSLIDHQINALADAGIGPVTMVVGYAASEIREAVGIRAEYVTNRRWDRTNSLYSFWLAREQMVGTTVILNSDVLFDPEVLERLLETEGDAFAIDSSSGQAREQMKVEIVEGRLADMRKDLPQDRVCGENVGILKLTYETVQELLAEAEALIEAGEEKSWLGSAVREVAKRAPMTPVDVADLPWVEIDFPNDLERARKEVWPRLDPSRRRKVPVKRRVAVFASVAALLALPFGISASLPVPAPITWEVVQPQAANLRHVYLGQDNQSWWLLPAGEVASLELYGPGPVRVDTRLLDPEKFDGHYVIELGLDGERQGWYSETTTPSESRFHDEWIVGSHKRVKLDIEAGKHELTLGTKLPEDAAVLLRVRRLEAEGED
jgi:choline kinase